MNSAAGACVMKSAAQRLVAETTWIPATRVLQRLSGWRIQYMRIVGDLWPQYQEIHAFFEAVHAWGRAPFAFALLARPRRGGLSPKAGVDNAFFQRQIFLRLHFVQARDRAWEFMRQRPLQVELLWRHCGRDDQFHAAVIQHINQ